MTRYAVRAPDYFLIPPQQVAELDTKVELSTYGERSTKRAMVGPDANTSSATCVLAQPRDN